MTLQKKFVFIGSIIIKESTVRIFKHSVPYRTREYGVPYRTVLMLSNDSYQIYQRESNPLVILDGSDRFVLEKFHGVTIMSLVDNFNPLFRWPVG